jgi:hypothetical protein
MTTVGKVIITISICVILLIVGVVGAGIYWWTHEGHKMVEAAGKSMEEGKEAGRKTDNKGCVDQALALYKKDHSLGGVVTNNLFLAGCLDASSPTPGFCDDVPGQTEIMRSATWQIQKCKEAGVPPDPYYRQIFSGVQQYCDRARYKSKP